MPANSRTRPVLCARIRSMLLQIYGARCAGCGCVEGDCYLEINHIYGRDWKPREVSSYNRWLRYWREAKVGLIDLRCPDCNQRYRPRRDPPPQQPCPAFAAWRASNQQHPTADQPF